MTIANGGGEIPFPTGEKLYADGGVIPPDPAGNAPPASSVARREKPRQHRSQGPVTRIMAAIPWIESTSTALEVLGIGTLTYGIWLKSTWIALIFLGSALILLGVATARGHRAKQ